MLSAIAGLVLGGGTLAQWVLYPISDGDSIEFHMQRVFFWIQNQSVAHFPTSGPQALSTYPFTHFVTTQMVMLSGGSYYLATAVSWFSYVAAALLAGAVVRKLGCSAGAARATFLVAMSMPSALLQATTGMHDLAGAMFALCTIYVALDLLRNPERGRFWQRTVLLGVLAALSLNAKITAAVVIAPFLLWLAMSHLRRNRLDRTSRAVLLVIVITAVLSTGMVTRNLSFGTGDPLGISIPGNSHMLVPDRSPNQLWVNLVRNFGNELAVPSPAVNAVTEKVLASVAGLSGIDIQDQTNMQYRDTFSLHPSGILHNTFSASPLTLVLVITASLSLLISNVFTTGRRSGSVGMLYLASAWFGLLFLGSTVIWTQFSARTLTTPLLAATPLIGIAVHSLAAGHRTRYVTHGAALLMCSIAVLAGALSMALNRTHPLAPDSWLGLQAPHPVGFWEAEYDELRYLTNSPWYEDLIRQYEATVQEIQPNRVTFTGSSPEGVPFHLFSLLPVGTRVELHGPLIKPHTRRFGSAGTPELSDLIVALDTRPPAHEMTFGGTDFRSVRSGSVEYPDYYELSRLYWVLLVPAP